MLTGKVLPVRQLTESQIETMFGLMEKYYDNMVKDHFLSDLRGKRDAVLLCDEQGVIRGFTTLVIFPAGARAQLLFSGDTIVEKEYWGNNDLMHTWIIRALSYAEAFDGKTYWLLLTKGYKTYKFLHRFFHEFYPRAGCDTPPGPQAVIDGFAARQFGDRYRDGVYAEGRDFLKEEFAEIGAAQLADKDTAFFLAKNPGYRNGDELVCLCELSTDNLNKLGRRVLGR